MKKITFFLVALLLIIVLPVGMSNSAEAADPEYSLSVNIIGSGVVTVNGSSPYAAGSVVVMTAYPSAGWMFSGWGGDLTGSTNPDTILMDSNKTVTAYFTEILNQLPVADAGGPYTGTEDMPISFDGSGSYDPDGYIYSYYWDFGDGATFATNSFKPVSHTYVNPGIYPVSLTVTDNDGATDTDTTTANITAALTQCIPTIESCDSTGAVEDTFDIWEDVYVKGTCYAKSTIYSLYLVEDQAVWSDGMTIPARVSGTMVTVSSDAGGNIQPTIAWANPLVPGKYDIVVDVNNNTKYDVGVDALDDNDIMVTAGFHVIPEVPLGTLMASLAMMTGLACYVAIPKIRKKK